MRKKLVLGFLVIISTLVLLQHSDENFNNSTNIQENYIGGSSGSIQDLPFDEDYENKEVTG